MEEGIGEKGGKGEDPKTRAEQGKRSSGEQGRWEWQ